MRLLAIEADDFMGYQRLDLDFAGIGSIAVSGLNNHGKSALLDAVTWCLYGRVGRAVDQRSSDLLVRRSADLARVRVTFDTGTRPSHRVVVTREKPLGRTMTLGIAVDGVRQTGHIMGRKEDDELALDQSQARIDALVGLPYEALIAGPFMVQRSMSSFIRAQPRERKDLLIRLLHLGQYETLHDAAKVEQARVIRVRDEAATFVGRLEADLADKDTTVAARAGCLKLQAEGKEAVRAGREALTAAVAAAAEARGQARARTQAADRYARAQTALTNATARTDAAIARLHEAQEALLPEPGHEAVERPAPGALDAAEAELQAAQEHAAEHVRLAGLLAGQADTIARAEQARAVLPTVPCGGEGIYATCPFLVSVPAEADIAEARASHDRTAVMLAEAVGPDLPTAQAQVVAAQRAERQAEMAEAAAAAASREWAAKRAGAEDMVRARQHIVKTEAELLDRDQREAQEAFAALMALPEPEPGLELAARTAQADLDEAEQHLAAVEERLAPLQARYAVQQAAEGHLAEVKTRFKKAERIATMYGSLIAAWHRDGVPTSIIEAAVPLIEARANEVLSRLPEDLTVRMRTQRPTKGGMAETLDVVVTIDGWESQFGLLSVGAQFRVDLALRLALAGLLTQGSGTRIETLWLDEPLADLDGPAREAVTATLAALADDFGLIVVVSHVPDFNDRLEADLRVRKADGIITAELARAA